MKFNDSFSDSVRCAVSDNSIKERPLVFPPTNRDFFVCTAVAFSLLPSLPYLVDFPRRRHTASLGARVIRPSTDGFTTAAPLIDASRPRRRPRSSFPIGKMRGGGGGGLSAAQCLRQFGDPFKRRRPSGGDQGATSWVAAPIMEPEAFTALPAQLAVAAGGVKWHEIPQALLGQQHSAAAAAARHSSTLRPTSDRCGKGHLMKGQRGVRRINTAEAKAPARTARPLLPSPSCRRRSSCSYSLSLSLSLLCSLFLLFLVLACRDIGLPDSEAPLVGGTVMAPARHLPSTYTDGGTDRRILRISKRNMFFRPVLALVGFISSNSIIFLKQSHSFQGFK